MAATLAQPEVFSHFPHAHGDAYGDAYSGARADVGQLATSEDKDAFSGRRATDGSAVRHRGRQFAKGAPPVRPDGTLAAARRRPKPKAETIMPVADEAKAGIGKIMEFVKVNYLKLTDMFHRIDDDGSGDIEPQELVDALRKMGLTLSPSQLSAVVHELDVDGDGCVEMHEYLAQMKRINRARFAKGKPAPVPPAHEPPDAPFRDKWKQQRDHLARPGSIAPRPKPFIASSTGAHPWQGSESVYRNPGGEVVTIPTRNPEKVSDDFIGPIVRKNPDSARKQMGVACAPPKHGVGGGKGLLRTTFPGGEVRHPVDGYGEQERLRDHMVSTRTPGSFCGCVLPGCLSLQLVCQAAKADSKPVRFSRKTGGGSEPAQRRGHARPHNRPSARRRARAPRAVPADG